MRLGKANLKMLGLALALASMVSCGAPSVRADIEAFANASVELQALSSFDYQASADETHALRNQNMYRRVQSLLQQQGLVESANPDFRVTVQTKTESTTIEYPAHYEMGPHFRRSFSGTAYVRGGDGNLHPTMVHSSGGFHSRPYRVPGRSVPAFQHHLALDFRAPDGEILWQGTIDSVHRSRDLTDLMDLLLPELLGEFPAPTQKGLERRVQRAD
ncbi:MAG: hypothetical protein COA70_09725 [Planctomycetota bacterium]|nr:MAG: hypothetical protein COA70_09725 [Planctomycetota bacterium]